MTHRFAVLGALITAAMVLGGGRAPAAESTTGTAAAKPNIVLIVADDLGYNSVGFRGDWVKTPQIDRLAAEGVVLDRFYVSPMCSPTRVGLLTGRYPMRLGMARSVVRPWMKDGLPPEEDTLPEFLGKAGYRHRGAFGKWHLGHLAPEWHPLAQGFTHFEGMYNGAGDYWTRDRGGEMDWHVNRTPTERKGYTTDIIADAAAEFIRTHAAESPFFCYVPFSAPHDPFQAPDEYVARYASLDSDPDDGRPSDLQILAAMITRMDDGIGRIMRAIDESGVTSSTMVWFISDNGGLGGLRGVNRPLRAGKLTTYEGGVRVPGLLWWPGVVEGGRRIADPIMFVDLLPTLLRAAGAPAQPAKPLDGIDVWEVLTGRSKSVPARDLYFFNGQSGIEQEQIAVISADGWKLNVSGPDIRRPQGYRTERHKVELFDLKNDTPEANDLADAHPERVAELGRKLVEFRASEPADSMAPQNRAPQGFTPPAKWENPETTATR
jgi:arylsulfatase B